MSTTFFVENDPMQQIPNQYYDESRPENNWDNPKTIEEYLYPNLNVSAINIRKILLTLDLPHDDHVGSVEVSELHNLMRKLIKLVNSETARSQLVRPDYQENNFITCGNTDERVYRYFTKLMEIVITCMEQEKRLIWA